MRGAFTKQAEVSLALIWQYWGKDPAKWPTRADDPRYTDLLRGSAAFNITQKRVSGQGG